RGQTAEVVVHHLRPRRSTELVPGLAEQQQGLPRLGTDAGGDAAAHVVDHAEHAHHRGRQNRLVAGLVVEAPVTAGHGHAELRATVGGAVHGTLELPHDPRVLRRTEVEAVGDGYRRRATGGDVAVRLGQRQLRARIRVEVDVPAVAV